MTSTTFARRVILGAAAALCSAALVLPAQPALATDTSGRSASEIQARWQQLKPTYSGSPYVEAPLLSAPYSCGSLASGLLQDGLNSVNYVRYLAGLPDDVALDSTYDQDAQHGAVLLAVGDFAHSQAKPVDMPSDFYSVANAATNSSNIGLGYADLWHFNLGCVDDADTNNIDRLGHRRWILNPPLEKTGMGLADSSTDTYVFDRSRTSAVAYDAIKWPCAGPFPAEMFDSSVPWSITLNPSVYAWTPGAPGHEVTLRRLRDGKTWTFTSADTNRTGEYFNLDTSGYGVSNCFIFRPDPASVGSYKNGDEFVATLSGGLTSRATGAATTVSYRTLFISENASSGVVIPTSTRLSGPSSVRCRGLLKLTGAVTPGVATGKITISMQRRVSGAWKTVGRAGVSLRSGRFKYTFRPTKRGAWRFVATYGGSAGSTAYRLSKSASREVRVR